MSTPRVSGCVKWFNNKTGYGFITAFDGTDVFVHHGTIKVSHEQYKYLVQGEYVEFDYIPSENKNHNIQAGNVTGVNCQRLMCETRSLMRSKPMPIEHQTPIS